MSLHRTPTKNTVNSVTSFSHLPPLLPRPPNTFSVNRAPNPSAVYCPSAAAISPTPASTAPMPTASLPTASHFVSAAPRSNLMPVRRVSVHPVHTLLPASSASAQSPAPLSRLARLAQLARNQASAGPRVLSTLSSSVRSAGASFTPSSLDSYSSVLSSPAPILDRYSPSSSRSPSPAHNAHHYQASSTPSPTSAPHLVSYTSAATSPAPNLSHYVDATNYAVSPISSNQNQYSPAAASQAPSDAPTSSRAVFKGNFEVSKFGKHPVLSYPIPGANRCYTFALHKRKRLSSAYRCIACCRAGTHVQIDVVGDEFLSDPCLLPHSCIPMRSTGNFIQRFMYKKLQDIRSNPTFSAIPVRRIWQDLLDKIPAMPNLSLEEIDELMDEFHLDGYNRRRRTISKSVHRHERPSESLDDVPEDLRTLRDGTPFLQFSSAGLYIYYSRKTIEKAAANGLMALVADGIHKLPPQALGSDGQLYTVHAVCNGIDVPLVHVLTRRKNENVYDKIFGMVKNELVRLNFDFTRLRIIIDFERAALVGIKRHFPETCIEGCGFHLSQAWNRRAQALGLRAEMRDSRVREWWRTLKGLMFLPPHLHRRVPALYRSALPPTHPAYQKCQNFLNYLHETWYAGCFKNIWCKWGKAELRTSNIAESYHRVLRVLIREHHAPVRKTLMCLRGSENRAMCTLRNLERGVARRLRRKDAQRRLRFNRCMEQHRAELLRPCPSTERIVHFCKKMSRFVSDKVI